MQILQKMYQEVEMRLTELQLMYRAAKKTAGRYKLWADGKELHVQQEWQCIVDGLQNVLQVLQAKPQAALTDSSVTDSAVTDSAVTEQVDEQIVTARHTGSVYTQLKVALLCD